MSVRVDRFRACVVLLAMAAPTACSPTVREFGGDGDGGGATTATTTTTTTGGVPTSSSVSSGSQGVGGEAEVGAGGSPTTVGSGGGGGQPQDCGDGVVGVGEECDDGTPLCDSECQVNCPSGWPEADGSCFGMAVGEGGLTPRDALTAAARCGELAVAATGHRAFPATPRTEAQFRAVAGSCPNNGCWLGYLNLEPFGGGVSFVSPATGDVIPDDAPWIVGGMHPESVTAVCANLEDADTGARPEQVEPALEAQPCVGVNAYFACELRPGHALISACGNGVVGNDEECDGGDDCSGCDRRCPAGWREDPASHACTILLPTPVAWVDAAAACAGTGVPGARLATPDDPEDVRILQFTATGSTPWIGLAVEVTVTGPEWVSGETFDYPGGSWPLPGGLGDAGDAGYLDGGTIVIVDAAASATRPVLCEAHAND